jgi:adenine-specific DNA-methyltransferase
MNLKGNNDEFGFSGTHEITLVYAKQKSIAILNQFSIDEDEMIYPCSISKTFLFL